MRLKPQRARLNGRINSYFQPPHGFVTAAMDLAMMSPAQWHGVLIADLAAKRAALRKAQVMGVARCAAADQAGLPGNELDVLAVAQAPRLG